MSRQQPAYRRRQRLRKRDEARILRFNLAHELGHVVFGEGALHMERAAHRFAAAFLIPRSAALGELGPRRRELHLQELHLLKRKYGVSMQAWIYRARDLGILPERAAAEHFRLFRSRGWHRQEPGEPVPPEAPKRMERLVMRGLAEELISERRAAELLRRSLHEIQALRVSPVV